MFSDYHFDHTNTYTYINTETYNIRFAEYSCKENYVR